MDSLLVALCEPLQSKGRYRSENVCWTEVMDELLGEAQQRFSLDEIQ